MSTSSSEKTSKSGSSSSESDGDDLSEMVESFFDLLTADGDSSDSSSSDAASSAASGSSSASDSDASTSSGGRKGKKKKKKNRLAHRVGGILKAEGLKLKKYKKKLVNRLKKGELPPLPTAEWQNRIASVGGAITPYASRQHERDVKAGSNQNPVMGLISRAGESALMNLGDKGAEVVTDLVADKIKAAVKDDAMPNFVKRGVDAMVDEVMPEIEEELKYATVGKLRRKIPPDEGKPVHFCPNPYLWFRAFVLYTLFPFNKSIWDKFRDPWWWFLTLVMVFPRYGVHQGAFLILLIMKDKRDEFQLLSYIMAFKGMAFLSQGIIPITVGAFRLYNCAVRESIPTCNDSGGPGAPRLEYFEAGFFALQVVLTFIAFGLVPFSKKKGAYRYANPSTRELDEEVDFLCCTRYKGRGGRLLSWVFYEFIVAGFCLGLVLWCFYASPFSLDNIDQNSALEWRLQSSLYWIKTLYGMLSIPYVIFKLPLMFGLLTHAKETGYNRNGKTLPMVKKPKKGPLDDDKPAAFKV